MQKWKYILAILFLIIFPLQLVFSQAPVDTTVPAFEVEPYEFWGETEYEVIEGELTVYEFAVVMGEEELGILFEQELIEAAIFKIISENTALVKVEGETAAAYIPTHLSKLIKKYGYSGMPVLVVKHRREEFDTDCDIIALGSVVKTGETYVSGTRFPVVRAEVGVPPEPGVPEEVVEIVEEVEVTKYPSIVQLPAEEEVTVEVPEVVVPEEPTTTPTTAALAIATTSVTDAYELVSYTFTFSASGGSGSYTWSWVSGSLPSGLSWSSGVISDTPARGTGGSGTMESTGTNYTFTVRVDDGSSTVDGTFTLKVRYYPGGITDYVWVGNHGDNDLDRINKSAATKSDFADLGVGNSAWGIAVDDKYVYVTCDGVDTVVRVHKTTGAVASIAVGDSPYGIAVDDTYVWVVNNGDNNIRRITKQDENFGAAPVSTITPLGPALNSPIGIAVDKTYIWVASFGNDRLFRINKETEAVSTMPVGDSPYGVAVDSTYAYVTCAGAADDVYRVLKDLSDTSNIDVGNDPYGIAVDSDDIWVANYTGVSVSRISTSSFTVSETIDLSGIDAGEVEWPWGISADDTYVFVALNGGLVSEKYVARITQSDTSSPNAITVGDDPRNLGDATGYSYDQFWSTSSTPVDDPHIHGRVYDSVTGENVTDVYTSLYRYKDTQLMGMTTDNPYNFYVAVANYYLRVEKEGYTFPSKNIAASVTGDHGEVFQGKNADHTIDIPIDPGYPLTVTKTANKKEVTVGDIITFNIAVENNNSIATINEIIIEDEITVGFKYAADSAYFDNDQQSDPAIASHVASFNIGKIPRYTTVNVSYQVRVGTGVVPGTYLSDAVAKDSVRGWQMSEEDGVKIDVIKDPLFELGTIIGKVFVDSNGNGVQDGETEIGVPNVKLVTEYGVIVYTDEAGRYHVPAVPPGLHAVKIDTNGLPPEVTLTTERTYVVEVTEGILRKVNFGIQGIGLEEIERRKEQFQKDWAFPEDKKAREEEELSEKKHWFFLVALGEGIVRNLSTSGNIDMVDHDDRFKDGVTVDGRLAYYLKAKVLGKFLITSSLDTDRKKNKLFTNLDPDKYYPVYGDASQIDYSAADTQNEFYVMIEYEISYLMWGDFHTDIPVYSRTLHGAKLDYVSVKKTKFENPYTKIKGFFANARQVATHDEFLGTGTSLYYLRHKDVVEGSEKVRVEVRHQVSKVVLGSNPLREEIDYEIDYDLGRIILKRPLTSVDYLYSDSIVSNDILGGHRVYLIVDYEYKPENSIRFNSWGVRATQQIGDYVRVGGTYINEEKSDTHYELSGGDLILKFNENTELRGDYSYSEETQLGSSISVDGGLTFLEESDTFSKDKGGNAWSVAGKTVLFNNTNINALYVHQDAYYSTTNSLATQGTRRLVANVLSYLTEDFVLGLTHVTQKLMSDTERVQSFLTGTNRAHTTTAMLDYTPANYDVRLEYQRQRIVEPIDNYTYFGTKQLHDNDFIAARIGYKFTEWLRAYVRGQGTVVGKVNNQGTIGGDIKLWERISLTVAETIGNLGNATLVGITSKYGEDSDIYANIEMGRDSHAGSYTKTAYGQTSYLGTGGKVYVETDYSSYKENLIRGNVIGYEKEIGDNLVLGISYERSFVEKEPQAFSRDAGSVSLGYLNEDRLKLFSKLECREDTNSSVTRQWVTENELMLYLTKDISLFGRANYSHSRNRTTDSILAEFKEFGVGLAFRPVRFDRLNLLGKYSYIEDDSPSGQLDFAQASEERKHVYAVEGAFDIFRYLQLVGKFAYKDNQEKVGPRDFTDSDTYLYIGRMNFHVTKKWDIAGEYRVLENTQTEDRRSGWLVEVNRELKDHFWLGAGYNFTDFDDDLEHDNNYDAEGWFIRAVGKY